MNKSAIQTKLVARAKAVIPNGKICRAAHFVRYVGEVAREPQHAELAQRGENAARVFLERQGYELCAQNLRVGSDEADLVMRSPDGSTLVIVEVKTRSCADAWPEERVDASKQRSLIRLARTLARRGNLSSPLRIDVIAINLPSDSPPCIRWFENAVMGS